MTDYGPRLRLGGFGRDGDKIIEQEGDEMHLVTCPKCKDVIYVTKNPYNKSYKFRCGICLINFNG